MILSAKTVYSLNTKYLKTRFNLILISLVVQNIVNIIKDKTRQKSETLYTHIAGSKVDLSMVKYVIYKISG